MPAGERLGAVVHSFHPPPIRGDPGEAHGEELRVVRACCVDLDAHPGAGPPHLFHRLVLRDDLRRNAVSYT